MRWLKSDRWKAGLALAGMLLLLVLMVGVPISAAGAYESASGLATLGTGTVQATPTQDATMTALNKEKLAQEIQQLKNQNAPDLFAWLRTNASILLVVGGGLFGLWRWLVDRRDAQDRELEDREAEREKRTEERFQKVVEGLGSERTEAKVGAAIMLRTFLEPGYERFYRQAFDLAVAHLRLRKVEASAPEPSSSPSPVLIVPQGDLRQEQQSPPTAPIPLDSLSQALITVFKVSLPLAREELKKVNAQFSPQLLDATGVRLDNAYLRDADLAEAWLEGASLRVATLWGGHLEGTRFWWAELEGTDFWLANLKGADLGWAKLERANLVEARLEEARLDCADIRGARLMGAHLEGAHLFATQLEGADFWLANLKGADLREAKLEGANPDAADSLKDTIMTGANGLTPEQRELCIQKGAIFDDVEQTAASDTSSSSSPPSVQSNETQAQSAPSTQSIPTPDTDGSIVPSSKPDPES